jgi:hypothetical protein
MQQHQRQRRRQQQLLRVVEPLRLLQALLSCRLWRALPCTCMVRGASQLCTVLLTCLAAARNINSKQLSDGSEGTHVCQYSCCHQVLTIVSRGHLSTQSGHWADTVRVHPLVVTNGVGLPEWACSDASRKQVL